MRKVIVGVALACTASLSSAGELVDQIGDADNFNGIDIAADSSFDWTDIRDGTGDGDGSGTDVWMYGDAQFIHTFDLTGIDNITAVTLEVFSGGQGWFGLTSLYLDDMPDPFGTLTDGDTFDSSTASTQDSTDSQDGANYARLDTFDLTPYLSDLLDGEGQFWFDTYYYVEGENDYDGWSLDYSRLTIAYGDSATQPVPEPGSLALLGMALAGLGFTRRKRG